MKPEIKTGTWPNGQKRCTIPYVNGQRYGLEAWWYDNGQKWSEIPYTNGQAHGLMIWWRSNGYLRFIEKRHQGQKVWEISFPFQEQIPEDAEVELFFHETLELI